MPLDTDPERLYLLGFEYPYSRYSARIGMLDLGKLRTRVPREPLPRNGANEVDILAAGRNAELLTQFPA